MAPVVALLAVVVALAGVVLARTRETSGRDTGRSSVTPTTLASLRTFPVESRRHVSGPVRYPESPPVGGDHSPEWQSCGAYSAPVVTERAVHSLERGAVWITYEPGLSPDEVGRLGSLAGDEVLVAPWRGRMPSPIVASAWGHQLSVQVAHDPRLAVFVRQFVDSSEAPDAGASCAGGQGTPNPDL